MTDFLRNCSWQFFNLLSEFLPEICWEEITGEILFVFCFDVWPGTRTLDEKSNKTTHYLLNQGDFKTLTTTCFKILANKIDILLLAQEALEYHRRISIP